MTGAEGQEEARSIPWGIAFTPDGTMLFTERGGTLSSRLPNGTVQPVTADFSDLQVSGQTGLMGIAVDPSFATNRQFYTCQGHTGPEGQVIRWTIDAAYTTATRIGDPFVGGLPFGSQNGGCRLRFGPNGYLWIATGDAGVGTTPQDLSSLGGKFLKVDASTGAGAPGNPFGSRVYTYGHRNPQGLALRPGTSQMWSVEHGPTVDDEINLLVAGANYGWDPVPGYNESVPMTDLDKFPDAFEARWSSGNSTLATSGGIFLEGDDWDEWEGRLAVATLKNQSLRIFEFTADGTFVSHVVVPELDGTYGRLRTPMIGPDGALYVTTSNGSPGEDLILKVAPSLPPAFPAVTSTQAVAENSPLLTVVATVTAIDPDGEALSYALGGPDAAFFTIPNSAAGQVRARTTLDYETRSSYAVIVTATDPYGLSDSIPVDITVTNEQERPGAPEAPTFSGETAESMTVNWSEPENSGPPISDYDVQYWEKGAGRFTDAQHEGPGLSLTLADLEAGTVYEVRVRATNDEGTGDWSESGEGRTVAPLTVGMTIDLPPPVEGAFTVRFSFSEVVRSFTRGDIDTRQEPDCRNENNDQVACNPPLTTINGPNFEPLQTTDNQVFTTTVTPQTEGVNHNYTLTITVGANTVISTLDSKPNEAATLEVRVAPPGVTVPISSIGLTASPGNGQVTLRWNTPQDTGGAPIVRYEYRWRESGGEFGAWVSVAPAERSATVRELTNGREYMFEVRPVNALGYGLVTTARAAARSGGGGPPGGGGLPGGGGPRQTVPGAPINLVADATDGAVTLTWEAPENDGGSEITDYEYRINRRNPWISIGSTNITHTVTGLDNGTEYVFEVRAVNRIGKSFSSNRAEATPEAPEVFTLDFAHFANGTSITSDLVLVNVAPQPVRPAIYFYDTEGAPIAAESVLEVTADLEIQEDGGLTVQTEMDPLAVLTISTHGQGELVSGSVKVVSEGLPIGGGLRYNLPAIGEAVVGARPPVGDALFPVRRQEGGINTGVAIHNLGEEAMEARCELMREGVPRDFVSISLEANGQTSWLIDQAFPAADTSDFTGSVRCAAPGRGRFTAIAVEIDAARRIFISVVPVDRTVGRGGETVLDFAHFVNGTWITDLVFVNLETQPSRPAPTPFHTAIPPSRPVIYFYDTEGALVAPESVVDVTGDLEITEDGALTVQTEMEPLGVLTISTHGRGELVSGSVRVVSDGPIGGMLRFEHPALGVAGVGASPPVSDALFPVRRQEGGITTGVALHNLESSPGLLRCDLMREGVLLDAASIPLEANGQTSWLIDQAFPAADTSDFAGSVRCDAVGKGLFSAVALEMDPGNRIFTTLPVVPVPEMPSQE